MKEVWKDIEGYEGLYQVSNLGRVKSLPRTKKTKSGVTYITKEKILMFRNCAGYNRCSLTKNNKSKNIYVHRLVARAFIPNPKNYKYINHKDCNPSNNKIENLEWCTLSHNSLYACKLGRMGKNMLGIRGGKNPNSKKVSQYDKNGNFIKNWNSEIEASKELNICATSISYCANKKRKTAGGYIWEFI